MVDHDIANNSKYSLLTAHLQISLRPLMSVVKITKPPLTFSVTADTWWRYTATLLATSLPSQSTLVLFQRTALGHQEPLDVSEAF